MANQLFVYSWSCDDDDYRQQQQQQQQQQQYNKPTRIRIYGIDDSNETICLRINNFTPYVYIEMYDIYDETSLNQELRKYCITTEIVMREHLYNFKTGIHPFMMCICSSRKQISAINWRLKSPINGRTFKCHESMASSILQLVSLRGISMAGWLKYNGYEINDQDRISSCDKEYTVKWKSLYPCDDNDSGKMVIPKIMAFDFEVNSEIVNAFPDDRPGDAIFQISCVFNDNRKILLTIEGIDLKSSSLLDGIEVISYKNEEALLHGFLHLIDIEKPNVISGYNIFKFDIPYLMKRCDRFYLSEELRSIGFNKSTPAIQKSIKLDGNKYGKKEDDFYIDWEGILILDLLPIVRRDYKLDNYKLHTVATTFLDGVGKDPVTVNDIFEAYRTKKLAKVGKYCVQDSDLCIRLLDKLNCWIGLSEMAKVCNVSIFSLYTEGQQLKIYSQVYKYCLKENIVIDTNAYQASANERYIGAHVFDPIPGYYKRVVPLDFSSLYPSIIIAYNICYSTIVIDESVKDEDCNIFEWEDHVCCDHDPQIIRSKELTKIIREMEDECKDLMHKRDIFTSKLEKQKIQKRINELRKRQKPYREERQKLKKPNKQNQYDSDGKLIPSKICEKRFYRFLKPSIKKGVIPTIIQNLLSSRKAIKNKIKDALKNGISDITVLDKSQLAYKVSANSMYGGMGVRKGYLPFMPGAMCVTYIGRISLEKTANLIKTKFEGELIYGDTDSNYVIFPTILTVEDTWNYAIKVADEISKEFPSPMKLEFEQTIYERFVILSKKRYMYQSISKDGILDTKIGKKGVVLARRDNSKLLRRIYERLAELIFDKYSTNDILYYILDSINDIFRNVIDKSDYIITQRVGNSNGDIDDNGKLGDYKVKALPDDYNDREKELNGMSEREYYVKSCPAQIQLAERMKNRGTPIDIGSRIEFVAIESNDKKNHCTLGDKIEDYDYYIKRSKYLTIDKLYYLHTLINPIDQLLDVGINDKEFIATQYKYRTKYKKVINELHNKFRTRIIVDTD